MARITAIFMKSKDGGARISSEIFQKWNTRVKKGYFHQKEHQFEKRFRLMVRS